MARPRKLITKKKRLTVHCTVADYLTIQGKAKLCKMSLSEYLLKVGLGKQINARLTDEEVFIFRQLTTQGNNLNQIARRVNQTGLLSTSDIEDLMKIKELIKRLQ